ncbi:hypothetical protein [uncultured Campylobacter sp.]|uniref:hypothetical protein n=1 Tax=uncultured Campylobacter sp. TaxID=218934 RepID=UPI0026334047|nr:hypothetical protein [uncultured Campylobacter sp.]
MDADVVAQNIALLYSVFKRASKFTRIKIFKEQGCSRTPLSVVLVNIEPLRPRHCPRCRFEIFKRQSGLNFTLLDRICFICHRRRNCVSFIIALNLQRRSVLNFTASALW